MKDKYVECETHGTSRVAFVCQHLLKGSSLGFHEAFESNPLIEPEDDYQAWCDDCEKDWEQEGEWNENFRRICEFQDCLRSLFF